jgi:carbon-monoxide dehydrogenase medium subunit/6-hydroxypseudooxynicotine dehydrogenase subunit alpha
VKPAEFEYDAPTSLADALRLLGEHGDEAKILAGGQSLVPLMNFRLVRPARLIDINRVPELAYIVKRGGALRVGALTRHAELGRSRIVAAGWPLLHSAVELVAHQQIRNRGTLGGSLAHADAAAELPVALVALGGRVQVQSLRGVRWIPWRELFVDQLTTSIEPDELLIAVEFPAVAPRTGTAFIEFSRRSGDYALSGVAVSVTLDPSGVCTEAVIAPLAAGPVPLRVTKAQEALVGGAIGDASAREAARIVRDEVRPSGDIQGGASYRRGLLETLVRRAIVRAAGAVKEPEE